VDEDRPHDERMAADPIAGEAMTEEPRRGEWWGIVLRTLVAVTVLAGAYVGLAYYLGDRIPHGTTVEGINVGSLDETAAVGVLEERLDTLVQQPVVLVVPDGQVELDPAAAGLAPDYARTLAGVTGLSFDPRNMWASLTGEGRALQLRTVVDEARLDEALTAAAQDLDREPVRGEVTLDRGEVSTTLPEPGTALDVDETAERVAEQWPQQPEVQGVQEQVRADVSRDEVQAFVDEVVTPALSGPVEVVVGDSTATISPNQLSRLLTVEQQGAGEQSTLVLLLDEPGLTELVRDGLGDVVQSPRDATVRLTDGGRPQVVGARVGREIDDQAVLAGVREVLRVDGAVGEGDGSAATSAPEEDAPTGAAPEVDGRTVTVGVVRVQPDITDEQADAWDVDSVMSEFRSQFPTGPDNADRTENIRVGLRYVNGSVVMPGEQFSLSAALAPITPERGYVEAGVISDGRLVKGIGGGLSQVSTTLLNAAWFAGVQLDAFTPHSYYISRYPEGREATIAVGVIDNVWTNDTDSPVIIQTRIQGDEILMRFWGDRQYTVDTDTSPRRNIVQPDSFDDDSEDCLTQTAVEGFTVTVTRTLSRGGDVVHEDSYTTTYQPSPGVTCTG
jgi:vancomycin resistance protein YoaR